MDLDFCDPLGIYDGFAYVAVSAQRVGINGYPIKPQGLIDWDPERYGSLSIPDDALSYDIYTQAVGSPFGAEAAAARSLFVTMLDHLSALSFIPM